MAVERLDKLVSLNCGLSRRDARRLIKDGAVSVNGDIAARAELSVDTETDCVDVDGYDFSLREHVYIMLNKPEGIISASSDTHRQTVVDLVPPPLGRRSLFPAGRLDRDTTGLLIITDDGDFTHRLLSPTHHVYKTYIAELDAPLSAESVEQLENGIVLSDGTHCLPAKVRAYEQDGRYFAHIQIREGKYHQVKRMTAACQSTVVSLRRIAIGALKLDETLESGECRELTERELEMLFEDAGE